MLWILTCMLMVTNYKVDLPTKFGYYLAHNFQVCDYYLRAVTH